MDKGSDDVSPREKRRKQEGKRLKFIRNKRVFDEEKFTFKMLTLPFRLRDEQIIPITVENNNIGYKN